MQTVPGGTREGGEATRQRILDAAWDLVLNRGFAGTSLDQLLKQVGITKGAFFYHFKSKAELGCALMARYAEYDLSAFQNELERARGLSSDPLQQLLIWIGLKEEKARGGAIQQGCLFATYTYEVEMFDPRVRGIVSHALLEWRRELADLLRAAKARHKPRVEFDPDQVADMAATIIEGAFVMVRALEDKAVFADQLHQYRTYIELLFDQSVAKPA